MKRIKNIGWIFFLLMIGLTIGLMAMSEIAYADNKDNHPRKMLNVAYVASTGKEIPDPSMMSHIFYSHAMINDDLHGITIKNPEYFEQILALREKNPDLKVSISIIDNEKGGMSAMCGSKKDMKAFVKSVKDLVNRYKLDGIDFDWEFPTVNQGTSIGRPEDSRNYAKLAKEMRKALGKDKLITVYSNNSALWIDFRRMLPYLDYVMASGYNLGMPPKHQSNLYESDLFNGWSVSQSIARHHAKGIPYEKMMMGIPFYARTVEIIVEDGKFFTYSDRKKWPEYFSEFTLQWDDKAQAPYYVDKSGKVVATFDTPQSIEAKAKFAKEKGLAGGFYWHYCSEDTTHTMVKSMHDNFK